VLEWLDARAPRHADVVATIASEQRPFLLPAAAFCEVGYFAQHRYGIRAVDAVLHDLEIGMLKLDCGERDIPRVRQLIARYDDLPLGSADAFVAACAERNGGRVLTLDRRHFDVVARELGLEVLPA
jgi:predicted nucleic acid-binding protein